MKKIASNSNRIRRWHKTKKKTEQFCYAITRIGFHNQTKLNLKIAHKKMEWRKPTTTTTNGKRTYEYDEANILNEIRNLPIPIRHKYYVDTSKDWVSETYRQQIDDNNLTLCTIHIIHCTTHVSLVASHCAPCNNYREEKSQPKMWSFLFSHLWINSSPILSIIEFWHLVCRHKHSLFGLFPEFFGFIFIFSECMSEKVLFLYLSAINALNPHTQITAIIFFYFFSFEPKQIGIWLCFFPIISLYTYIYLNAPSLFYH